MYRTRIRPPGTVPGLLAGTFVSLNTEGQRAQFKEALSLAPEDRARLASELLDSLDNLPPGESRQLWLEEARRRAKQIDDGEVELIAAEEVAKKAQALLK